MVHYPYAALSLCSVAFLCVGIIAYDYCDLRAPPIFDCAVPLLHNHCAVPLLD